MKVSSVWTLVLITAGLVGTFQYFLFSWHTGTNDHDEASALLVDQRNRNLRKDREGRIPVELRKGNGAFTSLGRGVNHFADSASKFHGDTSHSGNASRVAVLIPYMGVSLPAWFDAFARSAATSASLIDWLIIVNEAPNRSVPANVYIIRIPEDDLYWRLASIDKKCAKSRESRMQLADYLKQLLHLHPYILVEMKPVLGYIFQDFLAGYSHWAYGDMDTIMGRLQVHLTEDLLSAYDVITFSFGDNFRLYLRGQLTIQRNTPYMNNLWQKCDYFTRIGERLEALVQPNGRWDFESAEGCYSSAVVDDPLTRALYLPLQFSDAFHGSNDKKEYLVVGDMLLKCFQAPLPLHTPTDIQAVKSEIYRGHRKIMQSRRALVPWEKQQNLKRVPPRCSYWINPKFDVCVDFVPASAAVSTVGGNISYTTDEAAEVFGHCREAVIGHFQGWKRIYYAHNTRHAPSDAHALFLSDAGMVPIRLVDAGSRMSNRIANAGNLLRGSGSGSGSKPYNELVVPDTKMIETVSLPDQEELYGREIIESGSITYSDVQRIKLDGTFSHSGAKPSTTFSQSKSLPDVSSDDFSRLGTRYCLNFSNDLKKCTCYILRSDITLLSSGGLTSSASTFADATLVSVGWDIDYKSGAYDEALESWSGPKVLVLGHVKLDDSKPDARPTEMQHPDQTIVLRVNMTSCFIRRYEGSKGSSSVNSAEQLLDSLQQLSLPDKTLYNIGLDIAAGISNYVCISPPYVRFVSPRAEGWTSLLVSAIESEQQRRTEELSQNERWALQIALLIPTYNIENDEGRDRTVAFPDFQHCGMQQPARLKVDWNDLSHNTRIDFDARVMLSEKTLLLPVVFDTRSIGHGRGFVRLVEELNGAGCFGTSLFRSLVGAGYLLYWSSAVSLSSYTGSESSAGSGASVYATTTADEQRVALIHPARRDDESVSSINEHEDGSSGSDVQRHVKGSCGCSYDNDPNKLHEMVAHLNSFYLKAVSVRKSGLSMIYARGEYGKNFEDYQRRLHREKSN